MTKEERLKAWNENFKRWNAFNDNLETFIVIGNTYDIKDELKKKGAKFSPELGWHFDHEEPGYVLEKVTYADVGKCAPDGKLIIDYERAPKVIREIQERYLEPTKSEWVGEIGGRFSDTVTLKAIHSFQGAFGYTDVLTFEDSYGNTIVWFTKHGRLTEVGKQYILGGTIKAHRIFRNDKQTVVNRCGIKEVEV